MTFHEVEGLFFFPVNLDLREKGRAKSSTDSSLCIPLVIFPRSASFVPPPSHKPEYGQWVLISLSPLSPQFLLFKCLIRPWAASHQQNWTFTFPALPLSPRLSFTIPLSCLFTAHPCLYCKLSTLKCPQGLGRLLWGRGHLVVRPTDATCCM